MELSKFNLKDKKVEYAWRFNVDGNIEKLWNDDERSFLRFKIFATDAVSGFGRVFNRDFHIKKNSVTIQPPLRPDDYGENPLICVYGDTFFSF